MEPIHLHGVCGGWIDFRCFFFDGTPSWTHHLSQRCRLLREGPSGRIMLHFNRFTRFHIPHNPIKSQSRLFNPVICVGFKPPSEPAAFSHQRLLQSRGPLQPVAALRGPNRSICSPNAVVETGWTVLKFWFSTWLEHWREKKSATIQR